MSTGQGQPFDIGQRVPGVWLVDFHRVSRPNPCAYLLYTANVTWASGKAVQLRGRTGRLHPLRFGEGGVRKMAWTAARWPLCRGSRSRPPASIRSVTGVGRVRFVPFIEVDTSLVFFKIEPGWCRTRRGTDVESSAGLGGWRRRVTKAATPTAGREHGTGADRKCRRAGPDPRQPKRSAPSRPIFRTRSAPPPESGRRRAAPGCGGHLRIAVGHRATAHHVAARRR
ncbi:hypothetical protein BKA01_006585 [Pseudonocardia eucalypti]|nr:hypothetical protein [Pseudonocardia eucalypti]